MNKTTSAWYRREPDINDSQHSGVKVRFDKNLQISEAKQNQKQVYQNQTHIKSKGNSAYPNQQRLVNRRHSTDSVPRSSQGSRSSSQHKIKTINHASHTLEAAEGGAHYHKKSIKACFAPHKNALSAGLYKAEASIWLAYGRWFNVSIRVHQRHIRTSCRQVKLARIR